ncbi:L,D-transpeptidase [Limosilactobacillus reuteri]|uniref:L,D-transpeptidase n=1 Tax=Limosilactobacillus reuteri TaxID=1598 RepID=UPI001E4CC629|nr:L,D-transpeptidase [Limosilactobacillus reuteri]MCC4485325.1 L,D-transpeptidase [Limosilactobacillus reuteri]
MNRYKQLSYMLATLLLIAGLIISIPSKVNANSTMNKPGNYLKPSQSKPYPDLTKYEKLSIRVVLHKNRVYLLNGNNILYTMYCSGGIKDPQTGQSTTPVGHFEIQNERGTSFYNNELKEGANYWTSFKNHGEYLFHTVPTDANGNYKLAEAKKLGKTPASHGCIRLSVPDALFIQQVPAGTPVEIIK